MCANEETIKQDKKLTDEISRKPHLVCLFLALLLVRLLLRVGHFDRNVVLQLLVLFALLLGLGFLRERTPN
jgi:hypothetical protein